MDSQDKEHNSDSEIGEIECDTCNKMFASKAELDKHVSNIGLQFGFCHFCVMHGEELDFSWHPTFHVLQSNSLV